MSHLISLQRPTGYRTNDFLVYYFVELPSAYFGATSPK